jgi:hypothetical protein
LIGDAVNVSWKLQELTKTSSADLILSESIATLIGDDVDLYSLGSTTLDDSHHACEIFALGPRAVDNGSKRQIVNESWQAGASLVSHDFPDSTPRPDKSEVQSG